MQSFYKAVKENKNYIIFVSILFVLGLIVGNLLIDPSSSLMKDNFEKISSLAEIINEKDSIIFTVTTIFLNNFLIAFLMVAFGVLLGIYPIFVVLVNGLLIGVYIRIIYEELQSLSFLLVGLLPHGIFEISAIMISAAFGVKLGFLLVRALVERITSKDMKENQIKFKYVIKQTPVLLLGVLVILFVAAIIESTLSVYLLNSIY